MNYQEILLSTNIRLRLLKSFLLAAWLISLTGFSSEQLHRVPRPPCVKSILKYCLEGDSFVEDIKFAYDSDGLKISQVWFVHGFSKWEFKDSVVFGYDAEQRLIRRTNYFFMDRDRPFSRQTDQQLEYKGNLLAHKKIVMTDKDYPDGLMSNVSFYYKNGLKVEKDSSYVSPETSEIISYTETYVYEDSHIVNRSTFVEGRLRQEFDYEYANGKLVREEVTNSMGRHNNTVVYTYTETGQLMKKASETLVNEYFYSNGVLTEQHETYLGMDPGFHVCRSNYKMVYRY